MCGRPDPKVDATKTCLIMTQIGLMHASTALYTQYPHVPKFMHYEPLTVTFFKKIKQIQMQFSEV